MKKLIILLVILGSANVVAQENPVKIVFDVTSADEGTQQATVRHVTMMAKSYPDSEFEVVMYSQAMNMALSDKSIVAAEITDLSANKNVTFIVCAGTMKRFKATEEDLIDGIEIVPDGIMEIVMKQQEGWGYIKEARN